MPQASQILEGLEQYMAEIRRYKVLSREEESELARRVRECGDAGAAHKLVTSNLRFVVKVAYNYRGYGIKLLDLIQEGNLGLMTAVQKFEPARGHRLISYAVWWVRALMQNYILRSYSLVKVGTTQAQRRLFFRLRSEQERLRREAAPGDEAALSDVAEALGVREQDVEQMAARMRGRDFSLQQPLSEDALLTHQDALVDESLENDPERSVSLREGYAWMRSRVGAALEKLNEKERYIVAHRLMADEPETLQRIGDTLSISRERARQIEGAVIRKMKVMLRNRPPVVEGGLSSAA